MTAMGSKKITIANNLILEDLLPKAIVIQNSPVCGL
jgi:hypothetical protein